jgi:hypothetical protein
MQAGQGKKPCTIDSDGIALYLDFWKAAVA